jgi:protein TonB
MSTIANEWRMRRLGDIIQRSQPIADEVRRGAASTPASPSRPSRSQNVSDWQQALVARLDRFKRYPAQAHGTEGVASLAFTIDRNGNVLNSQIATTSGSAVLDAEVLALVKRAAPFPPPPAEVADTDLSFVIPIGLPPVNGASTGEDAEFAELFTSASPAMEAESSKERSTV